MIREGSIEEVLEIVPQIPEFEHPYGRSEFEERLKHNKSLILVSECDNKLQGFKCGYERDKTVASFYSWMGGVLPKHRRKGVAYALLGEMEAWCRQERYSYLQFKTLNKHRAMLLFALKSGFEITGLEDSTTDPEKRIWLTKKLN